MGAVVKNNQRVLMFTGWASAVAVSCPADTTEDILATVNIPAGVMGLNGILRVSTRWSFTGSVNAKTSRVRLGGIGGTLYQGAANGATDIAAMYQMTIQNRNAANSQIGHINAAGASGFGPSTGAHQTGAIDTSLAQTVVITGQKASAGETMTLETYFIELILPA